MRNGALQRAIVDARGDRSLKEFAYLLGERENYVAMIEHAHCALSVKRAARWATALGLPRTTFIDAVLQDLVDAADPFEGGMRVRVRCEEG